MEKINLLKKYLDMAYHNVYSYSENYSMAKPKDGYEKEWKKSREEAALLENMITEEELAERCLLQKTSLMKWSRGFVKLWTVH